MTINIIARCIVIILCRFKYFSLFLSCNKYVVKLIGTMIYVIYALIACYCCYKHPLLTCYHFLPCKRNVSMLTLFSMHNWTSKRGNNHAIGELVMWHPMMELSAIVKQHYLCMHFFIFYLWFKLSYKTNKILWLHACKWHSIIRWS